MRRVYAFIIIALTILAVAFINFKPIFDNANLGIEFRGGREVVYKITDKDGKEITDEKIINDASKQIINRLDITGVSSNYVTVEGENQFSVIIPSKDPTIIDHIKDVIEANITFTFTNSQNHILAKSEDLLENKGIYLYYDSYGSPKIDLKIKSTEAWGIITRNLSTSSDQQLVIWANFVEGEDILDNLNSIDNDIIEDTEKRIIANLSITEETEEKNVTYDGEFTELEAKNYNEIIRAGNIDYKFEFVAMYSVDPVYGKGSYSSTIIAVAIGLVLLISLLIAFYGLPGIVAAVSIILFVLSSLSFFNVLKGEYGPSQICALLIAIGVAADVSIITLERIKEEVYKGRSLTKAYAEGIKKSLSTIVDANIIILIVAFILYAIGTRSIKNFSTMLVVSSLFISIVLVIISRAMLGLLCKSKDLENKKHLFGIDVKQVPNVANDEVQTYFGKFAKVNFLKYFKRAKTIFPSIIAVTGVMFLIFTLAKGNGLNFNSEYSTGTSVTMTSVTEVFANENDLKTLFKETEGLEVNANTISISYDEDENIYYINVRTSKVLSEDQIKALNLKVDAENERLINEGIIKTADTPIEIIFTGNVRPLVPIKIIINAIIGALLAILGLIVYLSVRFRYTYTIVGIATLFIDVLVALSLVIIFNIPIGLEFIIALLAIGAYSIYDKTILFDRIREVKANYKQKDKVTLEDRKEMANKAIQLNFYRSIITSSIIIPVVISLIAFSTAASMGLYLIILAGIISCFASTAFLLPTLWVYFENRFEERIKVKKVKQKIKSEKKPKKKSNEPEEFVFYGIND